MNTKEIFPSSKSKLLIFGGVYSNFQAIQKLKQIAEKKNIEANNIICTGDIVAYCSEPVECIQLIQDWGIHAIAGNVELQLINESEDCACNFVEGGRCESFSKNWYPYAKSKMNDATIGWMNQLPQFIRFKYYNRSYFVLHGGLNDTSQYIFQSSGSHIKRQIITELCTDVVLAGHCGLPFSQQFKEGYWINSGVIGMPANDSTPRVWYLEIEASQELIYRHLAFNYNFTQAALRMREKALPEAYAKTLETGLWDNCEILPEAESGQQGVEIEF